MRAPRVGEYRLAASSSFLLDPELPAFRPFLSQTLDEPERVQHDNNSPATEFRAIGAFQQFAN